MQHALFRLGLYESKIDGLTGPGTRKAMAEYSKRYHVDNNFASIALDIEFKRREQWQAEWTDLLDAAVSEELETYLLDFGSAKIKEKILFVGNHGWQTACLYINAKNQFGAYTGYQWVFFPMKKSVVDGYPPYVMPDLVPPLPKETYEFWCQMGFVVGQAD
ncbi:hypothetical protein SAMN04488042_101727 [Shimia aestuarii]|uniref:Peptidoglycan binding domain-containing protein n=2 Tax=Shimia aestuarii TaxID=254406 RepID=A0A1I4ISD2_9RHOB|nr:hypothetical protein SAMN04488042_101727 [Shimia aestuarii]